MMNENKIYFDMDGVLADFARGVQEICGLLPLDQTECRTSLSLPLI